MENTLWKKGLVVGIIIVMIGASVVPSISKNVGKNPENISTVSSQEKVLVLRISKERVLRKKVLLRWIKDWLLIGISMKVLVPLLQTAAVKATQGL